MFALPVIPICGTAEAASAAAGSGRRTRAIVGVCLFLLLVFTTVTVFVREAWALDCFQIGIFALLAAYLLSGIRGGRERIAQGWTPWLVYLLPFWGVFQLLAHTTASTFETREAVLKWGSLAGTFFLTQVVAGSRRQRRIFQTAFLCFATAMGVLCLAQLFTANGRVLWMFPTGYPFVFGTFQYSNNYAQFVEVALPIALWRALREGPQSWGYMLCGGVLYASVVGTASRAGTALCTAELVALLVIGLLELRNPKTGLPSRSTVAVLVTVPALAAIFTLAVGWEHVWQRLKQNEPYLGRSYFVVAAANMARQRPLIGFGLGTFPEVYQRYAVKDFPFYANHAHNDWAEFAADGGIPFLLLVLIPFAAAIPAAVRHPWGIGLIAVLLHACLDYPFPRPAVSAWMFAMLALLYMTRPAERESASDVPPHRPVSELAKAAH